jgi:DNA segregation ATPase FtsK/SpoIIIE, S-DNA-T family
VVTTKRPTASSRARSRSAGDGDHRKAGTRRRPRSHAPSRPGRRGAGRDGPGVLSDHAADLSAIGLVTLGVLLALALYADAAGSVGHGVRVGLGEVVGWTRELLPVVCAAAGVMIVAGRQRPVGLRTAVGALVGLVAVCGLAELAGGSPRLSAPSGTLSQAGGLVGAGIGRPLADGLGSAGAVVVLVAVVVVACVVATGVSVQALGRGVVAASRWVGEVARRPGDDEDAGAGTGGEEGPEATSTAEAAPLVVPAPVPVASAATATGTVGPGGTAPQPDDDAELGAEISDEGARGDRATPTVLPGPSGAAGTVDWQLPPLRLLARSKEQRLDERLLDQAGEALVASLAAHGVETRLVGRTVGPTVTRFELELGAGVKVARVTSLARDIAYAMASPDVRILAPIPGKSAIGVEVPNRQRQLVSLGDILASAEAERAVHPLEVALGRDIAGRPVMVNLAEMPHVLISGATGAGKSSCINSLVTSVLMRATPDEVRLILVDPKRVELGQYNGLPHLLTPVVVDPKKAANALAWAVKEMERRYDLLAECGMRDITGYNEAYARGELGPLGGASVASRIAEVAARARAARRGALDEEPADDGLTADELADVEATAGDVEAVEEGAECLPYVLVVVDELNDLMMVAARDVEDSVCRIAQMARAVGIHLVLATQRPSVDVITGVIKANIPSRMAFSVSSLADSRVILDQPGAERLVGKGDMLLLTASSSHPRRLQAPWVSEAEVRAVVGFWRRQGRTPEQVVGIQGVDDGPAGVSAAADDDDELLGTAMELVVRSQLGSTSMLQRKLRVGFARAGRLMDLLERRGVVGPSEGSKARAVLMTPEELDGRPK